ncbi:prolyl oligopeptidase family serine peptidase [Aeromonas salmonicida]|uniref:prolyl oligopeptidase family serine peptidase n=1 Tax=Aeromonas salmonicida TaxID=645 RepID=UPI0031FDEE62
MDILEINLPTLDAFKKSELINDCSYKVKHDNLQFCFYVRIHPESDKLLILGQGAVDRKSKSLPNYQRISWLEDIKCNCIILQDPTLFLYENLPLGWCQGNKEQNAIPGIIEVIEYIRSHLKIKHNNICFYGSSAGGFSSLILAPFFNGAKAIVNNPQTNFLKYHKQNVTTLLRECFNSITPDEYAEKYSYFSASRVMTENVEIPDIYYYQNIADDFHLRNHLIPFIKELKNFNILKCYERLNVYLYDDIKTGHNPLSKSQTINIINHHFINNERSIVKSIFDESYNDSKKMIDDLSLCLLITDKDNELSAVTEFIKHGKYCRDKNIVFRCAAPSDESLIILKKHNINFIYIPNKTNGFCINFLIKKSKNKSLLLLDEYTSYKSNYIFEKSSVREKTADIKETSVIISLTTLSNIK